MYLRSSSFGHYSQLVAIGVGRNVNGMVKSFRLWLSSLFTMTVWCSIHSTAAATPNLMYISHSISPSLVNSRREEQSNLFQQRSMASDLEALTLIPTASYWTANHPSAFRTDDASKTISYVKSSDAILRFPNRTIYRSCP